MPNRIKFTPKKKEKFLDRIREMPNIARACRMTDINRQTVWEHRSHDPEFKKAFEEAWEEGLDRAEEEAYRRGVEGYEKPVIHQGEITDTYTAFSDTLLMFYLNGRRSEVFKNRHELTGKDGGALQIEVNIDDE